MSTEKPQTPVITLKDHYLKAAIWKNDSKNGPFYGATIERTYKDGDDYKTSHSFNGRDMLAAGMLLINAYYETLKLEQAEYEAANPKPV